MPMYILLRNGLFLILLTAGIIFIIKSKIRRKRLGVALLSVLLVTGYILSLVVPLEEAVLTFPSPEEAFHYKSDEEIGAFAEGNESTMVITQEPGINENTVSILEKTENRWKAPINLLNTKIVEVKLINAATFILYRYQATNDFYLIVMEPADQTVELSDNRGSQFHCLKRAVPEHNVSTYTYYAFLDGVDKDYVLTVDGTEVTFPKAEQH